MTPLISPLAIVDLDPATAALLTNAGSTTQLLSTVTSTTIDVLVVHAGPVVRTIENAFAYDRARPAGKIMIRESILYAGADPVSRNLVLHSSQPTSWSTAVAQPIGTQLANAGVVPTRHILNIGQDRETGYAAREYVLVIPASQEAAYIREVFHPNVAPMPHNGS